jgi:diguanylate cyclase (GGDEF)-like protein
MLMPDTPTVFLVGVVTCGLTAGLQWSLAGRLDRAALRLWAGANLVFGLGGVIYMLRPMMPVLVVDLVGNGLFLSGLGIVDIGIDVFDGRPPRLREKVVVVAVALLVLAAIRTVDGTREDLSIFTMSVAVAALTVRAGTSLLHGDGRRGRGIRLLCSVVMLTFATGYLLRGLCIVMGWLDPQYAATGPVGGVMRLSALTMVTSWTVGSFVLALDRLACTDELTGLLNRRAMIAAGSSEVSEALASQRSLSVLMIDLDHFKRVNDRFGHQIGDAVLRAFAAAARRTIRASDPIGRFGGEEFCILLAGADAAAAVEIAERLRATCASALGAATRRATSVTVSIGIATGGPGESFSDLMRRADAALYRAKAGGRDRVESDDRPAEAA